MECGIVGSAHIPLEAAGSRERLMMYAKLLPTPKSKRKSEKKRNRPFESSRSAGLSRNLGASKAGMGPSIPLDGGIDDASRLGVPRVLPKFVVGDVNDPLEREADAVAERVMRMPAPTRSLSAPNGSSSDPTLKSAEPGSVVRRSSGYAKAEPPRQAADQVLRRACLSCGVDAELDDSDEIHRTCASCEDADEDGPIRLDPAAGQHGGTPRADFSTRLRTQFERNGESLPTHARSFLEPRLGADLGAVRVHTDAAAGSLARQINARAFTLGQNIVFAPQQLRPSTHKGMKLLAHEVAHTLQSTGKDQPLAHRSFSRDRGLAETVIHRAPPDPSATTAPPVVDTPIPNGVQVRADLVDTPKWRTPRRIAILLVAEIDMETTIDPLFNEVMEKLDSDPDLKLTAVRTFLEDLDPARIDKMLGQPAGRAVLRKAIALAQADSRDTFIEIEESYKLALRTKYEKRKQEREKKGKGKGKGESEDTKGDGSAVNLHSPYLVPSAVLAPWAAPDTAIAEAINKPYNDILTCEDDNPPNVSVEVTAEECGPGFTQTKRKYVCMDKVQHNLKSLLGHSVVKEMVALVEAKYPGEDALNRRNMEALVSLGQAVRIFSTGNAQENKSSCKKSIKFDAANYDPTDPHDKPFAVTGEGVYAESPEQAMLDATKDAKSGIYVFIASVQKHHTATLILKKTKDGSLAKGGSGYALFWADQYTDEDAFGNAIKGKKIHGVKLVEKVFNLAERKFRTPAYPGSVLESIMKDKDLSVSERDRKLVAQRCANNHGLQLWMVLPRQTP